MSNISIMIIVFVLCATLVTLIVAVMYLSDAVATYKSYIEQLEREYEQLQESRDELWEDRDYWWDRCHDFGD